MSGNRCCGKRSLVFACHRCLHPSCTSTGKDLDWDRIAIRNHSAIMLLSRRSDEISQAPRYSTTPSTAVLASGMVNDYQWTGQMDCRNTRTGNARDSIELMQAWTREKSKKHNYTKRQRRKLVDTRASAKESQEKGKGKPRQIWRKATRKQKESKGKTKGKLTES